MKIELELILDRGEKCYKIISFENIYTQEQLPKKYTKIIHNNDSYFYLNKHNRTIILYYGLLHSTSEDIIENNIVLGIGSVISEQLEKYIVNAIEKLKKINALLEKQNQGWQGRITLES